MLDDCRLWVSYCGRISHWLTVLTGESVGKPGKNWVPRLLIIPGPCMIREVVAKRAHA